MPAPPGAPAAAVAAAFPPLLRRASAALPVVRGGELWRFQRRPEGRGEGTRLSLRRIEEVGAGEVVDAAQQPDRLDVRPLGAEAGIDVVGAVGIGAALGTLGDHKVV